MPGILPMKVIKVGTSAQSRIAQACDRCRSKKIRCDGFRPTCTQCSNVGFECKTSDKLSRRAFPRGYTESLEERVRILETETRELKDLLDEKDEKIDMLSKMHSQSPRESTSSRRSSTIASTADVGDSKRQDRESLFKLQQPPVLLSGATTDLYFVGNSSHRAFVATFKQKLQESGKQDCDFRVDAFFVGASKSVSPSHTSGNDARLFVPPSRLHSDQMVNIFFQEWAPLFPVLHRPAFLALYERYVSNTADVQDKKSLALLNLVFGVAALSNETKISHNAESCHKQWTVALDSFVKENSLVTLQCLILAQIYCIQSGDFDRLIHYKGLAVAIAHRLGLHLSQKRFALGILTIETRKKIFWSLYTLDCFSAAVLGLPRALREQDIECEYPVDADDEYVTEKGFQPTLPGESTRISNALAMFRACRIMAKVLEQNYSSATSHELSLQKIAQLDDELETWLGELPKHLRLEFRQEKPSTNTVNSRSPLLSLTYNTIRTLIHRPAICANLGDRASSSAIALASASKQIVQVIQLLEERNLSFAFCGNKTEILTSAGIGVLFQSLDLDEDTMMMKDNRKICRSIIHLLGPRNPPCADEFRRLGSSMLSLPDMGRSASSSDNQVSPDVQESMSSPSSANGVRHAQLTALAARYTLASSRKSSTSSGLEPSRIFSRSTSATESVSTPRRPGDQNLRPLAPLTAGRMHRNPSELQRRADNDADSRSGSSKRRSSGQYTVKQRESITNLDYLAFSRDGTPHAPASKPSKETVDKDILEALLALDGPNTGIHNGNSEKAYEWPPIDAMLPSGLLEEALSSPQCGIETAWSPDMWDLDGEGPQSVLSFSDESLTSGEEFSSIDFGSTRMSLPQMTPEHCSPDEIHDLVEQMTN